MSKGLKVGLAVLLIGISIPVATIFLTLRNKPTYHTIQPKVEDCFVQFTWQEKPVNNLEHLLILMDKPEDYNAISGLDMMPPEITKGYYILPRGVFHNNGNILKSKQKVFRMAKKDMRTWILIKGKAFPAELEDAQLSEIKAIIDTFKDHKNVDKAELGKSLASTKAWATLMKLLTEKKDLLSKGKLDLTPDRNRSDFMR